MFTVQNYYIANDCVLTLIYNKGCVLIQKTIVTTLGIKNITLLEGAHLSAPQLSQILANPPKIRISPSALTKQPIRAQQLPNFIQKDNQRDIFRINKRKVRCLRP